jgi:integrase
VARARRRHPADRRRGRLRRGILGGEHAARLPRDWADFTAWCHARDEQSLPADPAALSGYLTDLAGRGAKVGTMSRRLSPIRFAHQLADHPDPAAGTRVAAVWEGIRSSYGAPPEQTVPLMPPELLDVAAACPITRVWKTREPEPDLAGLRDRALLLVGFFAALRRSELAVLTVDQITDHDRGLVTGIARSKTNQTGLERELVVLPRTARPPGGRLSRARSQAAEPLQSLAVERGAPLGRGDHLGLVGAPADLLADRASRVAAGTGS